jgi:hypothetical protein
VSSNKHLASVLYWSIRQLTIDMVRFSQRKFVIAKLERNIKILIVVYAAQRVLLSRAKSSALTSSVPAAVSLLHLCYATVRRRTLMLGRALGMTIEFLNELLARRYLVKKRLSTCKLVDRRFTLFDYYLQMPNNWFKQTVSEILAVFSIG